MKPGMTIVPAQSITSASPAEMLGAPPRSRAVDQDVGVLEIADLRVERQHDGAAQEDAALPAVADDVLRRRWRRRGRASCLGGSTRRGCESCCGNRRRQELAARRTDRRPIRGHGRPQLQVRLKPDTTTLSAEPVAPPAAAPGTGCPGRARSQPLSSRRRGPAG